MKAIQGGWCLTVVVLIVLLVRASTAAAQSPQHDAVNAVGLQKGRSYFSPEPFEHYDTVSGNVVLSFTDLVLPGNAGRALAFQRTYNNQRDVGGQASRWSFGFPGIVMRVIEEAVPPDATFDDDIGICRPAWAGSPARTTPAPLATSPTRKRCTCTHTR